MQLDTHNGQVIEMKRTALGKWSTRPSFTLVELLIVIAVIGIMAGMVLYTLAGAQKDASIAKTQATIRKLNEIMLAKWEEFRYRAVKVHLPPEALDTRVIAGQKQTLLSPKEGARLRMMILRDTMRMEFPDRYSDILYAPITYNLVFLTADNPAPLSNTNNDVAVSPLIAREVPGIYNNFRRRFVTTGAIIGNPTTITPGAVGSLNPGITEEYQGAELLYQIVAASNFEGSSALEYFRASEIGDVDGDGMPEFLDGWGQPIRWIRWPAGYGFVDSASLAAAGLGSSPDAAMKVRPVDADLNDKTVPDPMDPLRTDWRWSLASFSAQRPWMLVPLIISAGPDGDFDIQFDEATAVTYATDVWPGPTDSPEHFATTYYWIDPYHGYYDNSSGAIEQGGLGQWFDENAPSPYGAADNITNYSQLLQ